MSALRAQGVEAAKRLLTYIDSSPTPYHAVANLVQRLRTAGFSELCERDAWRLVPGDRRYLIRDGGTLLAFINGQRPTAEAGFRIIGAHTDSPNLRLKPRPVVNRKGYQQLGVETYGGVLLSTWQDRDLSLAGRVMVASKDGPVAHLVNLERPVGRVSSLAIHLNRKVNSDGLLLNKQRHMVPMVGLGEELDLHALLAAQLGIESSAIISHDLSFFDTQKGALGGLADEFVFSPRIDNLGNCHAAAEAMLNAKRDLDATTVIALYDHEECGSRSAVGAASTVLSDLLTRIVLASPGASPQAYHRAIAQSQLISADMAHAIHPNYAEKHDDGHAPRLNQGLVIKTNTNQSYATTAATAARFEKVCADCGFAAQHFVVRSDMPCGSTIGPITAARIGIETIDVGAPMLSMHSCREVTGSLDTLFSEQVFQRCLED